MYASSPLNNTYVDYSQAHPPHHVSHPSLCLTNHDFSQHIKSTPALTIDRMRERMATGTRKHLTVEALLPLDAPIQPRKYLTPSATSRRDAFIQPGCRVSGGDENDELAEESTAPIGDLKQLEWKRRQNTLAARKSRQRKLQHQIELEESVNALCAEKETWKARALMYEALLRSNGINVPELS